MLFIRVTVIVVLACVSALLATPAYLRGSFEPPTPTNSAPVAVTDSYTVHGSLLMWPMQNDYDPDPGDYVTFQGIATQPQYVTLSQYSTGGYIYHPYSGYLGSDSFHLHHLRFSWRVFHRDG